MLTLFTIPKPFRGHIGVVQRNAIASWTLLRPRPEIILLGNDEGTEAAAKELGVRLVPQVDRNEFGTPLLNDLFEKAQSLATHDFLCYVNADIILMSDFTRAVERVIPRKRPFLMVGQRWDIEVKEPLDFDPQWEERLRVHVARHGQLHPPTGMDYFLFRRGFWGKIPPFAIGRTVWDNWLIYSARSCGAAVIDATDVVMAVHQNHDYAHIPGGEAAAWKGLEARRNLDLAGGNERVFTLQDATHALTPGGLEWRLTKDHLRRHLHTVPILYPRLGRLLLPGRRFLRLTKRTLT